jgi:hypothetical protein
MATIKRKPEIDTEIGTAITEGGVPAPVDSSDHKALLENVNESQVLRKTEYDENNLASGNIDFTAAGSRGLHIFNLVDNNYKITGFLNTVQGDEILLQINNDFDFSFDPTQFTSANSRIIGDYEKSASVPTFIRVRCARTNFLNDFFLIEFLNEEALLKEINSAAFNLVTVADSAHINNNVYITSTIVATVDTYAHVDMFFQQDATAGGGAQAGDWKIRQSIGGVALEDILTKTYNTGGTVAVDRRLSVPSVYIKAGETLVTELYETNATGSGTQNVRNIEAREFTKVIAEYRAGS